MVDILFALALEHPTHREKVARSCDGGDPFEATAVCPAFPYTTLPYRDFLLDALLLTNHSIAAATPPG
jgi:hypothetical protein